MVVIIMLYFLLRERKMKKFILIFAMLMAFSNVCKAEFVDKRFNQKLIPFQEVEGIITLSENQIYADNGFHEFYNDCKLLKNEIGYLQYLCSYIYLAEEKDTADKTLKDIKEFKITKAAKYFGCDYLVKEYDYDGTNIERGFIARIPYCLGE